MALEGSVVLFFREAVDETIGPLEGRARDTGRPAHARTHKTTFYNDFLLELEKVQNL